MAERVYVRALDVILQVCMSVFMGVLTCVCVCVRVLSRYQHCNSLALFPYGSWSPWRSPRPMEDQTSRLTGDQNSRLESMETISKAY